MNNRPALSPTLTLIHTGQGTLFNFQAHHDALPLPVVAFEPETAPKRRQFLSRLEQIIRDLYHFYQQHEFASDAPDPLQSLGVQIYQELLPSTIRETIENLAARLPAGAPLVLSTNDSEFPWELAHDGKHYLGMRWAVSRQLISQREQPREAQPAQGLRALLIGNPTGDLAMTEAEVERIHDLLAPHVELQYQNPIRLITGSRANKQEIQAALATHPYTLIHYSGHAILQAEDMNQNGLVLAGHEQWTAAEIRRWLSGQPWVFLNACNSVQGSSDAAATIRVADSGLVTAFILGGAQVVIGTLWPVPDQGANRFATLVYQELLGGAAVGQAIRQARITLHRERPFDPVWAAYTLYGPAHLALLKAEARRLYPVVTILAAQLLDPLAHQTYQRNADLDKIANRAEQIMTTLLRQVEQHGGETVQSNAHSLLAIFGLPPLADGQTHLPTDEHAERALHAAHAMQMAIQQLASLFSATVAAQVQVKIGIATGAVVLNHQNSHIVGRVAEAASWLAQQAAPGQTLVEQAVVQSARQPFETTAWQPPASSMPPFSWPLAAVHILGEARPLPFERSFGALLGREQPLQTLLTAWAETKRSRGQLIDLIGEAGIGKSHLVHEFSRTLSTQAAKFVLARCLSHERRVDYALLVALLRNAMALEKHATDDAITQAIRRQLMQHRTADQLPLAQITNVLSHLFGVESVGTQPAYQSQPQLRSGETAKALNYLLSSLVEEHGPLVLLLEDLHYIDDLSLEVLRRLVEGISRRPILCVAVYRPQWQPGWNASLPIRLDTLDPQASTSLINQQFQQPLPPSISEEIVKWSGGNPLFIIEVVRWLSQKAVLRYQDQRWSLTQPLVEIGLPTTVQGIIHSRVNLLSADLRELLEEAATLGAQFTRDLALHMLTQRREAATVEDQLLRLEQLAFLESDWDGLEMRFVHDVVHYEVLNSIVPRKRRQYHLWAARTWEEAGKTVKKPMISTAYHCYQIAHHRYQSVCETRGSQIHVLATDEVEAGYLFDAAEALFRAGEQARTDYANLNAVGWYQQALAVIETLGQPHTLPMQVACYDGLGEAQYRLGQWPAALEHLSRAFRLLQDNPMTQANQRRAADFARRMGRIYMGQANWEAALEWMQRGLHILGSQDGQVEQMPDTEDRALAALIYIHSGSVYYLQGNYPQAQIMCKRGLELAEREQANSKIAEGCKVMGAILDAQGRGAEAIGFYQRGQHLYAELQDRYQLALINDNMASALYSLGRWDEAFALDSQGLAFWESVDDRGNLAIAALNIGMIYLHRGHWPEAAEQFNRALEACIAIEDHRHQSLAYTNLGLLHLAQGQSQQGEIYFQKSLRLLQEHEILDIPVETLCGLSEAVLAGGNAAEALSLAQQALSLAQDATEMRVEESIALRSVGTAYFHVGDLAQAEAYLQESLQVAETFQLVFEIGRTSLALSQLYGETGRSAEEVAHLNQAIDIFTAVKATPLLHAAQQQRERLRGRQVL